MHKCFATEPRIVLFTAAGRVGSAFAAELGTMAVSEQTDSLRVLGSDPTNYLISPRVLACMIATPVLNLLCFCMGKHLYMHQAETRIVWLHKGQICTQTTDNFICHEAHLMCLEACERAKGLTRNQLVTASMQVWHVA